jgi:hypothetical protein
MSSNLGELAMGSRGLSGLAGAASGQGGALSTLGSAAGSAGAGLGLIGGIEQGGVVGDTSAAVNAAKLGSNLGAFGGNSSNVNMGAGDVGNALAIYQGVNEGGVGGYGGAGVNAAQLGSKLGAFGDASSTVGQIAGYAAIPLDVYNEVNNWKSGATTSDAMAGASTGAAIGSVIPGLGTLVGGVIGGAAGALSSLIGPGEKDPETTAVQNVINATSSNQNNPAVAASAQNPYLELAGLMDDRSSTLPEYQQYGRMGEQSFTNAMTQQINQAIEANPSLANNPQAVYQQVVAPWVNSMGSGYSNVGQAYTATNEGLLEDMTSQYLSGNAAQDWKAVGGDSPFANIYNGSPISAAAQPASTPIQQSTGQKAGAGTLLRARGGHIMRKVKKADGGRAKRKSVLDKIRPSFKEASEQPHFDGGGYVNYASYATNPTAWESPAANGNSISSQYTAPPDSGNPALQTVGSPSTNDLTGAEQQELDDINNPYGTGGGGSSSGSGLGSLAKEIAPYAALAPIAAALAGKLSGSGSSSATLPSGQSATVGPYQVQSSPRTANAIDPNTDWYTYGQHPETQFYSNNSIGPLMGAFVAQPSASSSSPSGAGSIPMPAPTAGSGTSTTQPVVGPRPIMQARGGALGSLDDSPDPGPGTSRYVQGAGDGTSDDIDAKLSDGEYVMDANTVSMLGNGSNKAGAARLDQLRENLRKHAAKPMAKGKQFMKAKDPMAYMGGGKARMAKGGRVKGRGKPVVFGPVSGDK